MHGFTPWYAYDKADLFLDKCKLSERSNAFHILANARGVDSPGENHYKFKQLRIRATNLEGS